MTRESKINQAVNLLLERMETMDPTTDEYRRCVENLEIMTRAQEHNSRAKAHLRDGLLNTAANFASVLVVANFERTGVWTSKALNFGSRKKF